jgi:beta-1,2-mannobiose phosphorylase / 1,2-beta-oligomannan phosphorylase
MLDSLPLGLALLDKNNPEEVLYRSEEAILAPKEDYENYGKVPNVVFSCGQVMMDDQLLTYYVGADSALC